MAELVRKLDSVLDELAELLKKVDKETAIQFAKEVLRGVDDVEMFRSIVGSTPEAESAIARFIAVSALVLRILTAGDVDPRTSSIYTLLTFAYLTHLVKQYTDNVIQKLMDVIVQETDRMKLMTYVALLAMMYHVEELTDKVLDTLLKLASKLGVTFVEDEDVPIFGKSL